MTFPLSLRRFSRVSTRCLFAAIVGAGVGQASGELWLYEGFDYTPATALPFVVLDESSFGFVDGWSSNDQGAPILHPDVTSTTGLSYGSLQTRGLSLRSFAPVPDDGVWTDALLSNNSRNVDTSAIAIPTSDAATIWVSFLLQRNSQIWNGEDPANEQDFAHLSLMTTGGGIGNVDIGELDRVDGIGIAQKFSSSASSVSLGLGLTKLIVLKLEMNAGSMVGPHRLELASLFVNPLIGQSDPGVDPVTQMAVNIPNLPSIAISSAFSGTEFIFDEIRIGSTYADVTPVPEPTSLLLLGTAGAALIGSCRRRKAA